MTPKAMWDSFLRHLAEVEPLGERDAHGKRKVISHQNFLGNPNRYEKIFLEANTNREFRNPEEAWSELLPRFEYDSGIIRPRRSSTVTMGSITDTEWAAIFYLVKGYAYGFDWVPKK